MLIRKYKITSWVVLLTTLAGCGGSGGGDDSDCCGPSVSGATTSYTVKFSPTQVVTGTPVTDTISASANLQTISGVDILASGSVTVSGISATAVTINLGSAGEEGPVILNMESGGGGAWRIPSDTIIDLDELYILEASGMYVAVETPSGRLRGQILPPGWNVVVVDLTAAATVPGSDATGSAKGGFAYNFTTGDIRARITTSGVNNVMSASIRNAIAGARGDVAIALQQSSTDPDIWGSADINNINADDRLTTSGLNLLTTGSLYFSVETVSNMGGELRGQILDESIDAFSSELTTFEVVTSGPPVISDAEGIAIVTSIESTSRFAVAVHTDITDALSVFINLGAPGENGVVVFSLSPDVSLPGIWVLPVTELTSEQVEAFAAGELYASVVTANYVDGELRGQLTMSPPESSLSIEATVDESTKQQEPLDASGGMMSMTTSNGALVTVNVAELTVAETKEFSITEITSISNFPADVELLAAVQMGPANEYFAKPVSLSFDVSGLRSPGTILIGFRSDDDGNNLRLLPLRDALGTTGLVSTPLNGTQVSVDVVGFSNIGVVELIIEELPGLIRQFLVQGRDFEMTDELALRLFNLALDSNFTLEEADELAENMLVDFIRLRRRELSELMADFINRPKLTPDDQVEFFEITVANLLTNSVDQWGNDDPLTSNEELQDSLGLLTSLAEVYGAGLHLQCFVNPEGVSDVIADVSIVLLLHLAQELLAGNPELTFEEIAAEADSVSRCFNQTILDAYFESFDSQLDTMDGTATNLVSTVTNNLANTSSTNAVPDIVTDLQLIEPRLVSQDPLIIEFKEATDFVNGIFMDTVRVIFDAPGSDDRTGRIELQEEDSFGVPSSPEDQENGERAIITHEFSAVGAGTILASPTSIDIVYEFDNLATNNGLLENITRNLVGDVFVSKGFTPALFADEIDLFE